MSARSVLVALLAALAGAVPAAAEPSLVLRDGRIWTGEGQAQAIAVEGARITAVGSDAEVVPLAGRGTRVVDLNGAFVAPGFTDHHTHVLEQGDLGTLEPSWRGYDPAAAEAVRSAILGYHAATFAAGQTPEDACMQSPVTETIKEKLLDVQDALVRQGLTTVVEAGLTDLGMLEALRALDAEGKLRLRFLIRVAWGCADEAAAAGYVTGWGTDWVRVVGVKLYSDGWLGPRSAALREPYADRPHRGFLFLGQQRADGDVQRARGLGLNVTTHAIGDRGLETMLTAYERAGVTAADRAQLEHAQVLAPDLIERMARVGAIASIQLSFATTDMRFAESALGPERAARSYAWRTLLDRGVRLVGSSDYPVEQINPLWGIQRIVTRTEFDGTPPGGWHPDQRLTVEEALRLITADGAYARLEEADRGRVRPGQFADLVVIREDLRRLPADCIAAATVLMTLVNGRVVFEGEQAYPPGDASCPSAAAPAKAPAPTSTTGSRRPAPARPARPCAPARAAAVARGRVRVRNRRLAVAESLRVATLIQPLRRPQLRRLGRRRAVRWRPPADGWWVLRLRDRPGLTEHVVVREAGSVTVRPPFAARSCGPVELARLSSPVFGGRAQRPLDVTFRLRRRAQVTVELRRAGETVQRLAVGERRAHRSYTVRVGGTRPPGEYQVRVAAGGRAAVLTARGF